jgi:hypothetical protein
LAAADGRLEWKSPKDHERRSVPFLALLTDELAKQMVGKGREDLLFSATKGGPLRVSTWRPRVFNPARDSLKDFPRVTPNDLRHAAASLAVSAGGNVLALARMLGHEDPSLTLRTYADLFDSDLDALADVLDQARTASLLPLIVNGDSEPRGENVPGTLEQTALAIRCKPATRLFAVGVAGFEPTTSSSRTKRATKLRHTPREATTAYRTGGR